MSKELPYFKFNVSEWLLGRISDENDRVQGLFVRACCVYWHKQCDVSVKEMNKKLGNNKVKELCSLGFLSEKDGQIFIEFLDEQFAELSELQVKRSNAGRIGGQAKRKQTLSKREAKPKHLEVEVYKEVDKEKKEVFDIWINYRKELKKPVNLKSTLETLINRFNSESIQKCIFVVNHSIENSYQGLFWDKYQTPKGEEVKSTVFKPSNNHRHG